ncbi:hypothetical protein Hanom_Chr01g00052341 [Helianthus anomalus]
MGELTCLMHSLSDNHVSFDKLRVFVIQYQMFDELSLFEACFIVMFVVLDWETMYMLLGIQPTHGGKDRLCLNKFFMLKMLMFVKMSPFANKKEMF